jgi:hypothetical protein
MDEWMNESFFFLLFFFVEFTLLKTKIFQKEKLSPSNATFTTAPVPFWMNYYAG